jgi:hypothetical protein
VCAVDRVDVPADGRIAGLDPVLLADQPVIREGVGQALPDETLDRRVCLGHERAVRLGLDGQVAPEMLPGDLVGRVAGGERLLEPCTQLLL